jgi:LPXTG-motif cell wall-anchored protein/uncharacterized repeat protein (TIGR02543 family)
MRNEKDQLREHIPTKTVSKKGLVSSALAVAIVLSLFSSTSLAYVDIDPGTVLAPPTVTGSFSVSKETTGSYVEPTNTFSDGSPTYYLITQDSSKAAWTSVTYDGVSYPLAGVHVGSDLNFAAAGTYFAANTTVFFDVDGTSAGGVDIPYNDGDPTAYTRFDAANLSLVGLYGSSSTTITKSAHTTDGTIERNIVDKKNIYMQGITFDGLSRQMCIAKPNKTVTGYGNNRGEYYFYLSGGSTDPYDVSDGFVMKDCVIQNIGSDNSSWTASSNKNVAINIYQSNGQHNFDNLTIRNTKTVSGLGIVSMNDSTNNYFRNLTIDGSSATSSYSIKIENVSVIASPYASYNNVFAGTLTLTQTNQLSNNVYIQDNKYKSTVVPAAYRYARYSTTNGSASSSAVNIYSTLPAVASGRAVYDLVDNYWIVQPGTSASVTSQLSDIKKVLSAVPSGSVPGSGSVVIKAIAALTNGEYSIPGFSIPDFGNIDVNVVAVKSAASSYSSTELVPLSANAAITYTGTAASRVRLFNFDFHSKAKYTLQEAIAGITPVSILLDPNESSSISGYPKYATYAPTSAIAAKILFATPNTFVNCRFTSLAERIEVTNAVSKLKVADSINFAAQLASSGINSYTSNVYSGNVNNTADDQTINWYSSDPTIVSFGPVGSATASTATALKSGSVTITAKAADSNNSGEIEKPFITFQLQAALPYTVTYYGNANTGGSLTNAVLTYLDGDTVTIQSNDTLEKDGYTFAGWNTTAAGDGVTYQPGDTLSITGSMELYAKWELIPITPTNTPTAEPTVTTAPTSVPTAEPTVTTAPTSVPTAEPTVTTSPTPSPTPSSAVLGADKSITPTPTATPTPTPTAAPSSTPMPTPTPATGVLGTNRVDNNLPKTGEASSPTIAFGILSILLSGGLLVLIKKRRKHYR